MLKDLPTKQPLKRGVSLFTSIPNLMLTDQQITAVESAIASFEPDANIQSGASDLERACREYQRLLRQQNPDSGKRQLAQLQRLNPSAYDKVLATIPEAQRADVTEYVATYAGKPLPVVEPTLSVSAAVSKGKMGRTFNHPATRKEAGALEVI